MNRLESFIHSNRADMLAELSYYVKDCQEHLEPGTDIDVRLCIDFAGDRSTWLFRTGSVDYDQWHSTFCGASSIGLDTDTEELLEDLINQCLEQGFELDELN